jgi:hypothetical protein
LIAWISSPLNHLLRDILDWMLKHPARLLFYSILGLSYFVFARPMLYSVSSYAYLIEWIIICVIGYQILNFVKNTLKLHHSGPDIDKEWRRHQQIINSIEDEDFNKMVLLQQEFVQSGARHNILLYLRQQLVSNGVSETQINSLLRPVIEYNDVNKRWYYRWFFKKQIILVNRYRRTQVLVEAIDSIREMLYPSPKFLDGVKNERN